jgi:hypothetical protein
MERTRFMPDEYEEAHEGIDSIILAAGLALGGFFLGALLPIARAERRILKELRDQGIIPTRHRPPR